MENKINWKLTESQINWIESQGSIGVTDSVISKQANVQYCQVQSITTEMWNRKMAKKELMEMDVVDYKIITKDDFK